MVTRSAGSSRWPVAGLLLAALVLAGCGADEEPPAIANPASENCVALGGTVEIEETPEGQRGWCLLPDGRRVDEWELWREAQNADDPDATDPAAVRAELDAAEARWVAAGIRSYTIVEEPRCFCPATVHTVTVTDGVVADMVSESKDESFVSTLGPWTVEELFAAIRASIDEGAVEVRVTYDAITGVPLDVWVDRERMLADEEWGVAVTSFVPAP
jgi:putative hemolysin